jgi:hypothetical protein
MICEYGNYGVKLTIYMLEVYNEKLEKFNKHMTCNLRSIVELLKKNYNVWIDQMFKIIMLQRTKEIWVSSFYCYW